MKTVAVVGLPNTGKSSWISLLSGQHMASANYSGVTVELKKIFFTWHQNEYCLIDVPGTFSLLEQKDEERVILDVFHQEKVDVIIHVINSTQIKSSLSLLFELRKLQIPMICLLNFKDEAEKNHIHIDCVKLSRRLSMPVYLASALDKNDKERCMELITSISKTVVYRPLYNPEVDYLFQKYVLCHPMQQAIELFEKHHPDLSKKEMQRAMESCMQYVSGSLWESNMKTIRIDEFLVGSFFGRGLLVSGVIIGFLLFLYAGLLCSEVMSELMHFLESSFPVAAFVRDVIFSALGSLLSFVPLYVMLNLYLAVIEESGLVSRFVLISEKVMRNFHLSGKSLISLILAHGCNVSSVVHVSSLDELTLKKKLVLLVPMCSCSARLPVYLLFVNHFFGKKAVLVTGLLILMGVLCVLLCSEGIALLKGQKLASEDIIEMPNYRKIRLSVLTRKVLVQCLSYIRKLIYVLFLVFSFLYGLHHVQLSGVSLFERIAKAVSVLYLPLGFGGNWLYVASLLSGIVAKEAVAGTFSMLMQTTDLTWIVDPRINFIYLVYVALTIPCVMTCHAIQQKFGFKMMVQSIVFSLVISYGISWMLYQFIMLF